MLGGLLFMLLLDLSTMLQGSGWRALDGGAFRGIPFIAALIGFMFKVLAAGVGPLLPKKRALHGRQRPGSRLCRESVSPYGRFLFYSALPPASKYLFLILALICLITGEVIHRIQFYDTYFRVGL